MAEGTIRPASLDGSNKESLLRDVRVPYGVNALMKTVQATGTLTPADRVVGEAAGCELVDVEHPFGPRSRFGHEVITPREVLFAVCASFTSLGGGGVVVARHAWEVPWGRVVDQGARVTKACRVSRAREE